MKNLGLFLVFPAVIVCGPHERRLINDLMANYKTLERPVANESDAVVLKFGLTLQQIMDVDERNQMISTNLWLNLEWHDSNLVWNETEYGQVKDIRMPPSIIWKPDILMYNSASEAFDGTYQTNVVVTSEGMCTYIPPGIFKSSCQIDITWFPFDDQDCLLKFGSWTYNGFNLDFQTQSDKGETSSYIPNGEWELLGVPAVRNEVIYDCCPEPYLDITFTIKMRRRTLYYFTNLIIPCLLISSMAVLGFTLPPDSGEKLSLGVTIMLAITIFSSIVGDMLPITDTTPLIGMYFSCIMFMVSSSCITTILILNYHHRLADTHEMPDWVQAVFLQWLPWLLHMSRRPGEKITRKTIMMAHKMELDMKETSSKSLLSNVLDMDDDFRNTTLPSNTNPVHHPSHVTGHQNAGFVRNTNNGLEKLLGLDERSNGDVPNGDISKKSPKSQLSGLHRELGAILKEIKVITDKIRDEDESSNIEADWKFAAMVIDRLCLIFFTLFTAIATFVTLAVAPHVLVW